MRGSKPQTKAPTGMSALRAGKPAPREGDIAANSGGLSEPVQVGVLLAGEMQEQRLQGAEFLVVVSERAIVGEQRDVAYPDEFAGLGDDGDVVADALRSEEETAEIQ